jgi:hypothetical protein
METIDHIVRQYDILPPEKCNEQINIIGAGAIGSHVATYLARMGFPNISVWDFDKVSIENMNSQGYRYKDINKPKVVALEEIIRECANMSIEMHDEAYTEDSDPLRGIVLACADSMAVRKLLWEKHCQSSHVKLFVDSRMGAEECLLYAMRPKVEKDDRAYRASLYSDEEAEKVPCTAKATCYTATMLSGLVCKTVKDWVTDNPYPREVAWSIAEHDLQLFKEGGNEDGSTSQSA